MVVGSMPGGILVGLLSFDGAKRLDDDDDEEELLLGRESPAEELLITVATAPGSFVDDDDDDLLTEILSAVASSMALSWSAHPHADEDTYCWYPASFW